jgi:hypothetical protein
MEKNLEPPPGIFAQLTLDFPFKKAFATEKDKDMLITLLNASLGGKLAHPITDVVIFGFRP